MNKNRVRKIDNFFKWIRNERNFDNISDARRFIEMKVEIKKMIVDIFLIVMGILSAGFGLKGFLLPNAFLDGGATGISLLISNLTGIKLSIILIIVNIPFLILGYNVLGKRFAIKTALAIVGLAACVAYFPYPEITHDKVLVSVFGGFFLGAGIGLAIRGSAVIDGTEVLAISVSKKSGLTIGDVILIVNVIIFSAAAWLLSIETALYAMLTYLSASKTVDFIIEGIEEYMGVTIISVKADKIRTMIINRLGRGITVYKGERGYGKSGEKHYDMKIIYTIVTRLEVGRLKYEIEKIDPNAFVVMVSVKDMKGGMIKKRTLKG
ncbi:MAG TPA: YitT family protein [Ferruginibacter sp.]|nr:YitT family protein [Ferruginibacter sp.]HRE64311.1 YitT family protein [Ferruginibacter sp.]